MWKAVVLVCKLTLAPADCTPITATDVLQAPAADSGAGCMFQAMAYLAESGIRLDGHYPKVVCSSGRQ